MKSGARNIVVRTVDSDVVVILVGLACFHISIQILISGLLLAQESISATITSTQRMTENTCRNIFIKLALSPKFRLIIVNFT